MTATVLRFYLITFIAVGPIYPLMTITSVSEGLSTELHTPELLDCIYGLNDRDKAVFQLIHQASEPNTTEDISTQLGCNRSTAHRSLPRLVERDIVVQQRVKDNNGYHYEYELREPAEIAQDMQTLLNDWYSVTRQLLHRCEYPTDEDSIRQD